MKTFTFLILIILISSCQGNKNHTDYLGIVNLEVTGNNTALPHFEKGLLLLHSFEYVDAREEFLMAQKADPTMSIAYWGEAMCYNHSLWGEQDRPAEALVQYELVLDKAKNRLRTLSGMEKAKSIIGDQSIAYLEE